MRLVYTVGVVFVIWQLLPCISRLLFSDDGLAARYRVSVRSEVFDDQRRTIVRGTQAASYQGKIAMLQCTFTVGHRAQQYCSVEPVAHINIALVPKFAVYSW